MKTQYYVFVSPPRNSKVFDEVLASYYANSKVGIVKAESDVHAVMQFRDRHSHTLSPTEQAQLEAVKTSSSTTVGDVHALVKQTYIDRGIL